jgi:hypothetical protein
MGRALPHFRTSYPAPARERGKARGRPVSVESPEFTREFMDAVKEATSQAVAEHLAAGNPVYITDDDGDICVLLPGHSPRKLSQSEIDALT